MYKYDIIKILILQFVSFYIRNLINFVSSQNNIFNFLCHHKITFLIFVSFSNIKIENFVMTQNNIIY